MQIKIISEIEQRAEAFIHDVDGEARKKFQEALAVADGELATFSPLLKQFEADLKAAVAAGEPAMVSAVETLLQKLLQDAAGRLTAGEAYGGGRRAHVAGLRPP